MKECFLLLGSILCTLSGVLAQTQPAEQCGFDQNIQQQLARDPQLRQRIEANEVQIQQIIARKRSARVAATVYTTPVVVHVIHTGSGLAAAQLMLVDIAGRPVRFTQERLTNDQARITLTDPAVAGI